MISNVGTMTSYLWIYDIMYMTSYPLSYAYDIMCWKL